MLFLSSRLRQVSFPLLNLFIFFGSDDYRKITWVDWNSVCSSKEVCCLRVRRIREFNIALLGKWCWKVLEEPIVFSLGCCRRGMA